MNKISFPALGLEFDISPVAFKLPLLGEVRWYGLLIGLGIILAFFYCGRIAKKEGVSAETLADLIIYSLPVAVICARTYYVLFSWDKYKDNLADVFKIWEGGLAIYGGLIGAVATGVLYCKVKKIKALKILDICCLGFLIGQLIGRWGNFMNAEAFGGYCSNFLGMSINGNHPVHPTFLYESLWNLMGLVILTFLHKKRPFDGYTFFCYVMWYGFGRFFIEGLRTDSLYVGNYRVSQIVAMVCVFIGIGALHYLTEKKNSEKQSKK